MSDERKPRSSFPPFSGGPRFASGLLFDPLAWGILMGVLLYLDITFSWMLLIVPAWVVIRIVLICRKGLW